LERITHRYGGTTVLHIGIAVPVELETLQITVTNVGLHVIVGNGSKLILSCCSDEFHTVKFKQNTQFAHSSNGINVCLAFFLHGKSNLFIAQNKEDICKPSLNYRPTLGCTRR
jgi:hypothetical protein